MSYLNKQIRSILFEISSPAEYGLVVFAGGVIGTSVALLIKHFLKLDCADNEYDVFVSKIKQEISKQKAMKNMGVAKQLEEVLNKKKMRCGK